MCMKPTMTEEERILTLEEKVARLQFDVYAMQNKIALKEDCDECPHAKCLYEADRKTEPQTMPIKKTMTGTHGERIEYTEAEMVVKDEPQTERSE